MRQRCECKAGRVFTRPQWHQHEPACSVRVAAEAQQDGWHSEDVEHARSIARALLAAACTWAYA